MPVKIRPRRGTAAQWTAANPVLALAEIGLETDTRRIKFGDAKTAWRQLPYAGSSINSTSDLPEGSNLYWTQARFDAALAAAGGAGGGVPTTRAINTASPLTGGGDFSIDRTHSMPQASATQDGYLSAIDFAVFATGNLTNLDGGHSSTIYGGTTAVDGGSA